MLNAFAALSLVAAAPALLASQSISSDTASRIDAVFARYTAATPGCALNVLRNGASAYEKGYGAASLELGVPISPRTVFDIGSSSKQFTAATIALLAQEGKLSLDDDIRKWVPELPDLGAKVTLRHLLTHTSGWRDYIDLMSYQGFDDRDHTTDDDALAALRRQKALNFTPGTDWRYSNTGYFLMSLVVKRVSGKSLADFARERIFEPLGMRDTHYLTDAREVIPNKATAYSPTPGGKFVINMSDWEQIGDGGVQTTVEDLAKWDANFDSHVVGGDALISLLQTTAALANGTPLQYALGLTIDDYRGIRRVQHGGAWAGFRAMTMRFPAQHLSIYTLCNRGDANTMQLANGVADVFLPRQTASLAGAPADGGAAAGAARFAGTYYSAGGGLLAAIDAHGDTLVMRGGAHLPFQLVGPGRFRHPVSGAVWRFDEAGGVKRLTIEGSASGAPTSFTAVEPAAAKIDAAAFAGSYYSPEIDREWRVIVRGDSLFMHRDRTDDVPLRPIFKDAFAGPAVIRFERDAKGIVRALTVTSRGVQALRMTKR